MFQSKNLQLQKQQYERPSFISTNRRSGRRTHTQTQGGVNRNSFYDQWSKEVLKQKRTGGNSIKLVDKEKEKEEIYILRKKYIYIIKLKYKVRIVRYTTSLSCKSLSKFILFSILRISRDSLTMLTARKGSVVIVCAFFQLNAMVRLDYMYCYAFVCVPFTHCPVGT